MGRYCWAARPAVCLGKAGTTSRADGQGGSMRRSSACDEMAWAKKQGHGECGRWAGLRRHGELGVSEVGDAVSDLGRRQVVPS